jgi:hypothetical protein
VDYIMRRRYHARRIAYLTRPQLSWAQPLKKQSAALSRRSAMKHISFMAGSTSQDVESRVANSIQMLLNKLMRP